MTDLRKLSALFILGLIANTAFSQLLDNGQGPFTRADSLRGMLTPLRTCYDVGYYDLSVAVYPDSQTISGTVTIVLKAVDDFKRMQIDLFDNMQIGYITFNDEPVQYEREFNAVFVTLNTPAKKGGIYTMKVSYSGKPVVAKKAPWDGGFVWTKDDEGNPWIAVACEGTGASLWWPNKDHLSDEPDSMMIRISVPDTLGLMAVANGKLVRRAVGTDGRNKFKQFDWRVSYPINNYNVTLNIGKYEHFSDFHISGNDTLALEYYVMPYNLKRAQLQFEQVKPMMPCYEKYFGRYPFWRDGFKLVETPYLGMEHQSAIAYGNKYKTGYSGWDISGIGLDFDYIIIHETGHEWWGNLVSCKDIADLWLHEGFCTYGEALYVECIHGYDTALAYVNAKKKEVENTQPLIGAYDVNSEGSGDMYNKGLLLLHTLRNVIENDSLWFSIIKGITVEFGYKTVSSAEVEAYISKRAGMDLKYFFDQYLRHSKIPVLEYKLTKKTLEYRWVTDVQDFQMPVKVNALIGDIVGENFISTHWIYPTTTWQKTKFTLAKDEKFRFRDDLFYFGLETVD